MSLKTLDRLARLGIIKGYSLNGIGAPQVVSINWFGAFVQRRALK